MKSATKIIYTIVSLFLLSTLSVLIIRCNNSGTKPSRLIEIPQTSNKVIAVYKKSDGTNEIAAMLRITKTTAGYDSASNSKDFVTDTLWGRPVLAPMFDSLGKQKKDTTGKALYTTRYISIPKDSVNYHIEGKDIDSLLKHFNY